MYIKSIKQTAINMILILTVFSLSDYKNPSPGVAKRKLPVREIPLGGSPVSSLSMFLCLYATCILYHLRWKNHFHTTRSLLLA